MTHDELLADINNVAEFADYEPYPKAVKALRAVVELHRPSSTEWDTIPRCAKCRYSDGDLYPYPCWTIQAITEQLK